MHLITQTIPLGVCIRTGIFFRLCGGLAEERLSPGAAGLDFEQHTSGGWWTNPSNFNEVSWETWDSILCRGPIDHFQRRSFDLLQIGGNLEEVLRS
jgi:hypothetical protein